MRDIQEMVDKLNRKYPIILIDDENGVLPDQYTPVMYACPVCGEQYGTVDEAAECRDQPYDNDGLKVGDIVVVPGAWANEIEFDDPWLAFIIPRDPRSDSHFDQAGFRVPFFVVTAIHGEQRDKHRCVVTLASLYEGRLRIGWNPANGEGHHEIFKLTSERSRNGRNDYWIDKMGTLLDQCVIPSQVKEEAAALAAMGLSTRCLI
jgi:hypothetical protein